MKLIKTASGKYKLSKRAWEEIGKNGGWHKTSARPKRLKYTQPSGWVPTNRDLETTRNVLEFMEDRIVDYMRRHNIKSSEWLGDLRGFMDEFPYNIEDMLILGDQWRLEEEDIPHPIIQPMKDEVLKYTPDQIFNAVGSVEELSEVGKQLYELASTDTVLPVEERIKHLVDALTYHDLVKVLDILR